MVCCLVASIAAQEPVPANGGGSPPSAPQPLSGDGRAQYPAGLANSFVSLNAGLIHYPFSQKHIEPGHHAGSIDIPHAAARAVLFGRHFGEHISAQASYMRPVKYVKFRKLDASDGTGSVWMHFGTVTLLARAPIGNRTSLYGEGGLAITSRAGFEIGDGPGVKDAHFASPLLGAGVEYRLDRAVDLVVGASFIPPRSRDNNPYTVLASAGVRYNMRPLPASQVAETVAAGFVFPKNVVQAAYATDAFGFGVNTFLNKTVPVFWGGAVRVKRSIVSMQWQRNLFHTKKVFAFDVGAGMSRWTTGNDGGFHTVSVYPLARFTFLRMTSADMYASYSVAGPTYISRVVIDGRHTGSHFTFQDFLALGMFIGPRRRLNVEINLNHYSNGNLLPENAGVMVPLAVKLGYAF